MARRRKIPVRKHHGVRDPIRQLEVNEKKLKNLINSPPKKDDQKMSYKFAQFKKLADHTKSGLRTKRIRSGVEDKPKDCHAVGISGKKQNSLINGKNFKTIKQMPGEEDVDYIRRVNRITRESLKEAQYEIKYGVKVMRDPKTGEIFIKKKPSNEIDDLLKQKRNNQKGGKNKLDGADKRPLDTKLVKALIKQVIDDDKEEKRKEKEKEIVEYRKDEIKFGEIVHAPPSMLALPRNAQKNETVPRPGKKQNLLLQNLLNPQKDVILHSKNNNNLQRKNSKEKLAYTKNKNQLKGKRKDLPEATRRMLENEREKLINIYRELKKSKGIPTDKS